MKTLEELRKIRKKTQQEMKLRASNNRVKIVVGMGTSSIASGAREIIKAIIEEVAKRNLTDVVVAQTGEKGLSSTWTNQGFRVRVSWSGRNVSK